jgi:cytochrome P450
MDSALIADDPLYFELYDVRNEALEFGNLVETDVNSAMGELRSRAPVQKGFLRELLDLPPHARHGASVGREGYTCFSFEVCNQVFRDSETFSSDIYHFGASDEQTLGLLEMGGDQHRSFRATLQPMFLKPRTLTWWRQRWINEIVAALIENLKGKDRAELNLQLCARLPVHTITRAIGMDGEEALTFRHALMKSGAGGRLSPEEQRQAAQTVERMLFELIAKRRAAPGDDVISGLLATDLELPDGTRRPLTDREIMINCRLVMIAGGGTSWRQFGITLWALMTHPDQYEAVKADRSLIDPAIEESVRWNPTDPVFSRLATRDTELKGVPIPADAVMEICLGAGNRDPERWENPHAYDLHRPAKTHIGFGIGPHQCLGMNVARSEINVGLNGLFDAFPRMRLDPDAPAPQLTGGLEQRGMSALPVLLT